MVRRKAEEVCINFLVESYRESVSLINFFTVVPTDGFVGPDVVKETYRNKKNLLFSQVMFFKMNSKGIPQEGKYI